MDTERSSGEGVGGRAAGDEDAGVCPPALSSSVGCEALCGDMLTARTRPLSLS